MRPRFAPLASSLVVLAAVAQLVPAAEPPRFTVERLGDRVLALRSGETGMDGILVLSAARGLVVIDTGISPTLTKTYRAKIEEVLGRKDFLYVINTDHHRGHILGNQYFLPAAVIAHERAWRDMRGYGDNFKQRVVDAFKREPAQVRTAFSASADRA